MSFVNVHSHKTQLKLKLQHTLKENLNMNKKPVEISPVEMLIVFSVFGLIFWALTAYYPKMVKSQKEHHSPVDLPATKPSPRSPIIKKPSKRRRYPQWHFRKRGKQSPVFAPEELKIPSPNPCKRCPSIPT